jgi:glycosyltransferase involved in cell wall biosynthesis
VAALAIVTSSPPGVEGGHMVVARSLAAAARAAGHDARLVVTPDYGFGRLSETYRETWRTDVRGVDGVAIDQVISLRFPSYAVRHPAHVCWLNHTMREYYDLWPRFAATVSRRNYVKERVRRALLHAVDGWLLRRNVTRVVAQSSTIQARLADDFGVRAPVVRPPPPPRAYRCDGYGDFILSVSRLTALKRVDLLVRALAEPVARRVTAAIAGEGEERGALERLAASLGVADRVRFLGRVDDAALVDALAACRAVCFAPFAEDYGFVTVEAFAASKAVITCRDSGGPTELVRDHVNGFLCEPTPDALALALARVADDRTLAERLGSEARRQAAALSWDAVVRDLVIV